MGWADGTGGIWPTEEKGKERSDCCPQPSKEKIETGSSQSCLVKEQEATVTGCSEERSDCRKKILHQET